MTTKLALLRSLYSFLKEVILGKATLKEAFKYDPRRVYALAIIVTSLILNVVTVPLVFDITHKYVVIKKENKELRKQIEALVIPD